MQPIDNLDELMRRAADAFPLNTDSGDWNKVLKSLHEKPKERKRRIAWLWISAIMATSILVGAGWWAVRSKGSVTTPVKNTEAFTNKKSATRGSQSVADHEYHENSAAPNVIAGTDKKPVSSTEGAQGGLRSEAFAVLSGGDHSTNSTEPLTSQSAHHRLLKERNKALRSVNFGFPSVDDENDLVNRSIIRHFATIRSILNVNPVVEARGAIIVSSSTSKVSTTHRKVSHMYVTLLGGIDQSNIKMQKTSAPGYTAGVLASYQFSARFSVEGGLWWDKKEYYTKGEYFNMKLYSNATIKNVHGNCSMIELPLSVQYRFSNSPDQYWFTTIGVSSYLMKRENYEYDYTTGASVSAEGYKTFINSTNNLFSVVRLSGGFTRRISHSGSIRVEPYVGLPIQGLGIGKLPIASGGINVGLTRRIF